MGRHFWARGYFVSTVGRDERVIREYIRKQEQGRRASGPARIVAVRATEPVALGRGVALATPNSRFERLTTYAPGCAGGFGFIYQRHGPNVSYRLDRVEDDIELPLRHRQSVGPCEKCSM